MALRNTQWGVCSRATGADWYDLVLFKNRIETSEAKREATGVQGNLLSGK